MTVAILAHAGPARTGPRGFVPPSCDAVDTRYRRSDLDPRPLWLDEVVAESPWRSPTFWLACALVMPVSSAMRLLRSVRLR